jgi:16S rRNA (adenine1518-N6/adenine1519-N6)-dimethyltransferase
VAARRKLGQHFLSDPNILRRITDALQPARGDRVLEIGPGRGALTRELIARGVRLTAIERDSTLLPRLRETCAAATFVDADALDVSWADAVGAGHGEPWLAIGNIPYYVTSPLIDKALEPPRPVRIVFLVQREVADRLTAEPGSKAFGALTVGVQAVARAERIFRVPAGAFAPPPKVDSTVVRLTPTAQPLVADSDRAAFRRLVTSLFAARRKQLVRALRTATGCPAATAERLAAELGVEPERRPETLEVRQFVRLFELLVDEGK